MLSDREQLRYTVLTALNIISVHSPTAAMLNYVLWGYVLPQRLKHKMEKVYA